MIGENMGQLIPKYVLDTRDSGRYIIKKSTLMQFTTQELDTAQVVLQALVNSNPDFEFSAQEEIFDMGIIIHWVRKPREPRTEAQSSN